MSFRMNVLIGVIDMSKMWFDYVEPFAAVHPNCAVHPMSHVLRHYSIIYCPNYSLMTVDAQQMQATGFQALNEEKNPLFTISSCCLLSLMK